MFWIMKKTQGQAIIAVRRSLFKDGPEFWQIFFYADFRDSVNYSHTHDIHAAQWTVRHFKWRWVLGEIFYPELSSFLSLSLISIEVIAKAIFWHYRKSDYLNLLGTYFSPFLEMCSIQNILTLVSVGSNLTCSCSQKIFTWLLLILSCLILPYPVHSPHYREYFIKTLSMVLLSTIWYSAIAPY